MPPFSPHSGNRGPTTNPSHSGTEITDKKRAVDEWVEGLGKRKDGELTLEGEMTPQAIQMLARKYIAKEKLRRMRIEELRTAKENMLERKGGVTMTTIETLVKAVDVLRVEIRDTEELLRKEHVNVTDIDIV